MKAKVFKVDGRIEEVKFEGGTMIVEYSEFKNGDIMSSCSSTLIYRGQDETGAILFNTWMWNHDGVLKTRGDVDFGLGHIRDYSLSTTYQKERFMQVLAEQGKQINPETKELEDIVSLPSDIKIFKRPLTGRLGIGFNDNRQMLFMHNGLWAVSESDYYSSVKTKLTPCKRSDLKAGDLAVGLRTAYEIIDTDICLVLGATKEAWAIEEGVYFGEWDLCNIWYKIEEA